MGSPGNLGSKSASSDQPASQPMTADSLALDAVLDQTDRRISGVPSHQSSAKNPPDIGPAGGSTRDHLQYLTENEM